MESSSLPWSRTLGPAAATSMMGVISFTHNSSASALRSGEHETRPTNKKAKKGQSQRRLEAIERRLGSRPDDGSEQAFYTSRSALTEDELLILTRIYLDHQDERGDGFWTLVTVEFARQTRRKHGSLQRVYKTLCEKWKGVFEEHGSGSGKDKDTPLGMSVRECLWVDQQACDGFIDPYRRARGRNEEARDATNMREDIMKSLRHKHRSPSLLSVTGSDESIDDTTEDDDIANQSEDLAVLSPSSSLEASPYPSTGRAASKYGKDNTKRKGRGTNGKSRSSKEPWQERLVDLVEMWVSTRNDNLATLCSKVESATAKQATELAIIRAEIQSLAARTEQSIALLISRLPQPLGYEEIGSGHHGVVGRIDGARSNDQYGL